jgi:hypothetical protein
MTTCTPFASLCRVAALTASFALACGGKPTESNPTAAQSGGSSNAAEAIPPKAQVGQPAPDFEVRDETGSVVRLADHRGKQPVLLAFYPKDFTSG